MLVGTTRSQGRAAAFKLPRRPNQKRRPPTGCICTSWVLKVLDARGEAMAPAKAADDTTKGAQMSPVGVPSLSVI